MGASEDNHRCLGDTTNSSKDNQRCLVNAIHSPEDNQRCLVVATHSPEDSPRSPENALRQLPIADRCSVFQRSHSFNENRSSLSKLSLFSRANSLRHRRQGDRVVSSTLHSDDVTCEHSERFTSTKSFSYTVPTDVSSSSSSSTSSVGDAADSDFKKRLSMFEKSAAHSDIISRKQSRHGRSRSVQDSCTYLSRVSCTDTSNTVSWAGSTNTVSCTGTFNTVSWAGSTNTVSCTSNTTSCTFVSYTDTSILASCAATSGATLWAGTTTPVLYTNISSTALCNDTISSHSSSIPVSSTAPSGTVSQAVPVSSTDIRNSLLRTTSEICTEIELLTTDDMCDPFFDSFNNAEINESVGVSRVAVMPRLSDQSATVSHLVTMDTRNEIGDNRVKPCLSDTSLTNNNAHPITMTKLKLTVPLERVIITSKSAQIVKAAAPVSDSLIVKPPAPVGDSLMQHDDSFTPSLTTAQLMASSKDTVPLTVVSARKMSSDCHPLVSLSLTDIKLASATNKSFDV